MKKIFLILVLGIISSASFACPNLSGEYFNEEFGTYYSIQQDSCDLVQYVYDEGVVDAPVDGVEYIDNDYDIIVEEGKILANVKIFSSRVFKGDKLITNERSLTTYSNGDTEEEKGFSEKFLDKNNNLVTIEHSKNGKHKIIEKRVK